MLLANQAVAEKILRHFPSCALLRRHQTPAPRQFEPIVAACASAGIALDVSSSKALSASLDAAARADDAYFNKLVRIMTTRCMTQAQYFGSGDIAPAEYHHYGLASDLYTHFTSPIRCVCGGVGGGIWGWGLQACMRDPFRGMQGNPPLLPENHLE